MLHAPCFLCCGFFAWRHYEVQRYASSVVFRSRRAAEISRLDLARQSCVGVTRGVLRRSTMQKDGLSRRATIISAGGGDMFTGGGHMAFEISVFVMSRDSVEPQCDKAARGYDSVGIPVRFQWERSCLRLIGRLDEPRLHWVVGTARARFGVCFRQMTQLQNMRCSRRR